MHDMICICTQYLHVGIDIHIMCKKKHFEADRIRIQDIHDTHSIIHLTSHHHQANGLSTLPTLLVY